MTPTLAASSSNGWPANAKSAMNNATVNPIPAVTPRPRTAPLSTSAGSVPAPVRTASRVAATTPIGLPSTRATTIAPATVMPVTVSSDDGVRRTPAFANANNGTNTNDVHNSSACSTRAIGETASRDRSASSSHSGASASGGSGSSTVASAIRRASALTARGRWNGAAGASTPITTPAIAGSTPARHNANHNNAPSPTYTTMLRTCARSATSTAATAAAAHTSPIRSPRWPYANVTTTIAP